MAKIFKKLFVGDTVATSGNKCFKKLSTELPKLTAPTISITDDTLTITHSIATSFDILIGSEVKATITTKTFDLATLELAEGTYSVSVVAKANGYSNSAPSNAVEYVVEPSLPVWNGTDLTGTTWRFDSGWTTSGYSAKHTINGTIERDTYVPVDFTTWWVGYKSSTSITQKDITFTDTNGSKTTFSNNIGFYVTFKGGTAITNTTLIGWCKQYGTLTSHTMA